MRYLAALLFLAMPAVAADGVNFPMDCGKSLCVVPITALKALFESNNMNYDRAEAAEAKLKRGCIPIPKAQHGA